MTNVDQFESVFRSADKAVYNVQLRQVKRVLLVVDLDDAGALEFKRRVQGFLGALGQEVDWMVIGPQRFATVSDLLKLVEHEAPDLVCTYRNLKSSAWHWPYSLGSFVDVLTQLAPCPVLVVPHPESGEAYAKSMQNTDVVMAVTDHMAGDSFLVDYAASYTQSGGKLLLTHVQDEAAFEHLQTIISKIPSINSDNARETIGAQLLKEPREYVESCERSLEAAGLGLKVECIVEMGERLTEYERLARKHEVDLLVFHTRKEGQLAMGGNAYTLAVELREIPLLML